VVKALQFVPDRKPFAGVALKTFQIFRSEISPRIVAGLKNISEQPEECLRYNDFGATEFGVAKRFQFNSNLFSDFFGYSGNLNGFRTSVTTYKIKDLSDC
jgi:hypothetical protein